MSTEQVAAVRRFHRLVTQRAGALEDHFLGRDRHLSASRLLYEIGPTGADLGDLRARLGLDPLYLHQLVESLEEAGLVTLSGKTLDEQIGHADLTRAGRVEYSELNRRSDDLAESILSPLTEPQRDRLVSAMSEVYRLLRLGRARIERVDPASREARWCVAQYFAEINRRFEHGFDPSQSLPADDEDFRPPAGAFLVASTDGDPVACGAVKTIAPQVGYLKRMWVSDSARGLGIGSRMLRALEDEARALGMTTVKLETNRTLVEAISMYRHSGYTEVAPFNDEPYAHHWFEKQLEAR